MTEFICKHCGSADIYAEVEARGHSTGDVHAQGDGKPYFEIDRTDYDDVDIIEHCCGNCNRSEFRLGNLVIEKQAEGELRQPCGRCDHDVSEHPLPYNAAVVLAEVEKRAFTRPLRPCTVEGCDCHDLYDTALSFPNENQLALA